MSDIRRAPDLIVLHGDDNVATALKNVASGSLALVAGPEGRWPDLLVRSEIRLGHKAATKRIEAGALAIKHGVPFGRATAAIAVGEHVHVHNVLSLSRETDIVPSESAHA